MPMIAAMRHPRSPLRRRRLPTIVALAATAVATACVQPPQVDERGAFASARQVLAIDFGRQSAPRRQQRLRRWPDFANRELRRAAQLTSPRNSLGGELARSKRLTATAVTIAADDLRRRPDRSQVPLPSWPRLAQNLSNGLDQAFRLLGSPHPLGEIDDHRHRTDYRDNRPEASWWTRLRRRLWP